MPNPAKRKFRGTLKILEEDASVEFGGLYNDEPPEDDDLDEDREDPLEFEDGTDPLDHWGLSEEEPQELDFD